MKNRFLKTIDHLAFIERIKRKKEGKTSVKLYQLGIVCELLNEHYDLQYFTEKEIDQIKTLNTKQLKFLAKILSSHI